MKAEHRKELQTNVLADRLGRLVQGAKTGPSQKALLAVAAVVLVVVVLVAWIMIARRTSENRAKQWVAIDEATSIDNLDDIIKGSPGSLPARDARFMKARKLMQDAQAHLFSPDFSAEIRNRANLPMGRSQALESIQEAGKLYEELAKECKDNPVLVQEALMGLGTCHFIRGEYPDAIAAYQELRQTLSEIGAGREGRPAGEAARGRFGRRARVPGSPGRARRQAVWRLIGRSLPMDSQVYTPTLSAHAIDLVTRRKVEGMRLDQYLVSMFPDYSRSIFQKVIDAGAVTVNSNPAKASYKIRHGDQVRIVLPEAEFTAPRRRGHSARYALRGRVPRGHQQARRHGRSSGPGALARDTGQRPRLPLQCAQHTER